MANISIETKKFTQLPTTQSLTDSSLMLARDVAGVKTIQFSDLRAQLQRQTYVQEIKSKNILDSSKLEQGNISESTGADVVSTNRVRTGFIPVEASETYTASVGNSKVLAFAFLYNSGKTYLDYKILSGEGATSPTFTVSASTAYVRITVKNSDDSTITPANVTNFQLELGDTATPYVPYAMDNMELSEICRGLQDDGFIVVPKYSFTDLGVSSTDSAFFLAWLQKLGSNYDKYKEKFVCGRVAPNSYGAVYGQMYGGVANDNTPMYSGFTYITFNGMKYFGTNNGTFFLRAVNYTVEV